MSDEARRYRLGLFVIGGVVLAAVGIVAISAGRLFQAKYPLYCYFQENVTGLEEGSAVKFRGVEIGRVAAVNVMKAARIGAVADAPNGAAFVEVRSTLLVEKIADESSGVVDRDQIDASIRRKVDQGLRVRIAWKDITGQKYLDLDYVDPQKSPPPALPFEPPGTSIPAAMEKSFSDIQRDVATVTSELARVDIQGLAGELKALMESMHSKVDQLDTQGLGPKLGAAADAVRELARSPRLEDAVSRIDEALARFESVATRIDNLLARPGMTTMVDDTAAAAASMKRVGANLEETIPKLTASLDETLVAARRLIDESKLPETTAATRAAVADVGDAARQVAALRESARRTLADLGAASRGLGQLVRYLEENPNALLRGKTEEAR